MGRDRSLDEFFDDGAGDDEADTAEVVDAEATSPSGDGDPTETASTGDKSERESESESGDAAEGGADSPETAGSPAGGLDTGPATITMAFASGGKACEACGGTVERRWRDGDALVCADCKEW